MKKQSGKFNLSIKLKMEILLLVVAISILSVSTFSVVQMKKQSDQAIAELETEIRSGFDDNIKQQVQNAASLLNIYYGKYQDGTMTLEEAKVNGANMLRELRYGTDGYFFADTLEGNCVVLLGNSTEGTNRNNLKDSNGVMLIQEMRKLGQQEDGGFLDLQFPKAGETVASPKRNYALEFKPFGWIIGTGNYVDYIDAQVTTQENLMKAQIGKTVGLLVTVSAISFIITILLAISIILSIIKPIKQLTDVTEQLAAGNLDKDVDDSRRDEVGKLAKAMKALTIRLKTYIAYIEEVSTLLNNMGKGDLILHFKHSYDGEFAQLKNALEGTSDLLKDTLRNINIASEQVSSGSDQVSSAAQALSEGATEQASSIEELSATIQEISKEIDNTANHARNMNELSNDVGNVVKESKDCMSQLEEAMNDIKEKSKEIGNIIKSIDDIAFQTNILALNASVEAARAGAAGKGFAVVADEVRNLAQKSADAASNTNDLIQRTIIAVNKGAELTNKTAQAFDIVDEKSSAVNQLVGQIASASVQQANGASQVLVGVDQISSVVQTNSATAEESAASSEELSAQAKEMLRLVKQFRIDD